MQTFQYHEAILNTFPSTVGGIIFAQGLTNSPSPDTLQSAFLDEQRATLARLGNTPLSDLSALSAWRSTFRRFNVEPTKYRCSAEALLRRLTKKGDIPSINTLVDIGNLVSIRYALPLAVFDTQGLTGAVTVHFADGTERYTGLGDEETIHPDVGEVVFSDETGLVIARRWCWRQSAESAANADTTHAIITVEAQHDGGRQDVENAVTDLLDLLNNYAGGTFSSVILDVDNPLYSG